MYVPIHLRLTLFYTLLLGLALLFFGNIVYMQAEQRAYSDLDNALSSRTASVRLGKLISCPAGPGSPSSPAILPSVDGLGAGGIAIEVLDDQLHLLATTTSNSNPNDPLQSSIDGFVSSPIPWDARTAHTLLQQYTSASSSTPGDIYSTITYQDQHVRVYTVINNSCSLRVIQTTFSEQGIEQSLSDLRLLLIRGGALVLGIA